MKDYEVWTAPVLPSGFLDTILRGMGLKTGKKELKVKEKGFRTEEGTVVRTDKTEEQIGKYYNRRGLAVLSITECTITKDQELQII